MKLAYLVPLRHTLFCAVITLLLLAVACQNTADEPATTRTSAVVTGPNPTNTPVPTRTSAAVSVNPVEATAIPTSTPRATATATLDEQLELDPGALISLRMESQVGVLLDEFPEEMKERVTAELIAQPEEMWRQRAIKQVELTYNRLHFRGFAYAKVGVPGKGQLPYPPPEQWQIELDPAGPAVQTIDGHELVMINYTFSSTLLTDVFSPGEAEAALAEVGGSWREPFVFPADPTMILQRTSNACLNEGGFPPNSYDSENVATFYDYTCQSDDGGVAGCHRTTLPSFSCQEALNFTVGTVDAVLEFEHLEWDEERAAEIRIGQVTSLEAPDLLVVGEDLENHRITYRYFPADSCALQEACVGAPGWRRLLQFDATVHNVGAEALHIGPVLGEDLETNLFEYDACHNHIHYSNYGDFLFGPDPKPNKRAFCVESTSRFSNNELSPLTHPYTCSLQGIQAGWVDEYGAGLDCQWIDITDATTAAAAEPVTVPLTFRSNTNEFLCEGEPVLDENGERVWAFSGQYNEAGLPIAYPLCELSENWDVNNQGTADVLIPPSGSFVTQPCESGQTGPLRNCGFTAEEEALTCNPGEQVTMRCELTSSDPEAAVQVVRVCEASAVLETGTACAYNAALANMLVGESTTEITFTCPLPRDAAEPGGLYAFYSAPIFTGDPSQSVSCEVVGSS